MVSVEIVAISAGVLAVGVSDEGAWAPIAGVELSSRTEKIIRPMRWLPSASVVIASTPQSPAFGNVTDDRYRPGSPSRVGM